MKFIKPMNFISRADRLTEFERGKFANNPVSKNDAKQERGDRRADRSKRDVLEYVKSSAYRVWPLAQVIEIKHHRELHPMLPFAASSPRTTRSIAEERLPLTKRRSPGSRYSSSASTACSCVFASRVRFRPAPFAACAISRASSPTVIR